MSAPNPLSGPENIDPRPDPQDGGLDGGLAGSPDVSVPSAEERIDSGRRRRRAHVLIAAAVVVFLMLGGAAYAGRRLWYGSGAQPEDATPSTVAAFVRLDLSPGYGQRRKVDNLLKKFPQESGKNISDGLEEGIFEMLDIDKTSYRKHVQPWFANRVGVALWLSSANQPYSLVVLATDDEQAAVAGLGELRRAAGDGMFGFAMRDGYALVAKGEEKSQAAAEAAVADAERESLADLAQFQRDVDWLPEQQTALAWVDLGRVAEKMLPGLKGMDSEDTQTDLDSDVLPSPSAILGGGLGLPALGGGLGSLGMLPEESDVKGRVVVGAQATDDGLEFRVRAVGVDVPVSSGPADIRATVDSLPADSVIAASTRIGDLGDALDGLVPDPDELLGPDGTSSEELLKGLPPGEAEQARKEMEQTRQEMEKERQQFEALSDALSAAAGAKLSVAVTEVDDSAPVLGVTAEAGSAEKAADLSKALKMLSDDVVTVSTSGNKVELKTKGYVADGGTLAGQALYRQALAGAPKDATAVLYLDIQRLLAGTDLSDEAAERIKPVKAVGVTSGTEGDNAVSLIRVIIK